MDSWFHLQRFRWTARHGQWCDRRFCGHRPDLKKIGTFIPPAGTGNNGEGVELLFPSVMLAGILMVLVSVTKLSRFITL
ncbi:APX7, partial [Symbiodinium necroappetens]